MSNLHRIPVISSPLLSTGYPQNVSRIVRKHNTILMADREGLTGQKAARAAKSCMDDLCDAGHTGYLVIFSDAGLAVCDGACS